MHIYESNATKGSNNSGFCTTHTHTHSTHLLVDARLVELYMRIFYAFFPTLLTSLFPVFCAGSASLFFWPTHSVVLCQKRKIALRLKVCSKAWSMEKGGIPIGVSIQKQPAHSHTNASHSHTLAHTHTGFRCVCVCDRLHGRHCLYAMLTNSSNSFVFYFKLHKYEHIIVCAPSALKKNVFI